MTSVLFLLVCVALVFVYEPCKFLLYFFYPHFFFLLRLGGDLIVLALEGGVVLVQGCFRNFVSLLDGLFS